MKKALLALMALGLFSCASQPKADEKPGVTFVGRTDYSDPLKPKQWAAGGYFTFGFVGESCEILINCEEDWQTNFIEITVDDLPSQKVRTKGIKNSIIIGQREHGTDTTVTYLAFNQKLDNKEHHVTITRDSETGMGFTQLDTIKADKLVTWTPKTDLKIEFIGNSITCGAESDTTEIPKSVYKWGDWHRAYEGYGPKTAKQLNAQYSLVSVSGIGLIHSCCDMEITMPMVYDKLMLRNNELNYKFDFCPDIICSCLGQNDGIQDSTAFASAYVDFIKVLVSKNPSAKKIILLTSPMANDELQAWMKKMLPAIVDKAKEETHYEGLSWFAFSKAWNSGGVEHPSTTDHDEIASELVTYLKKVM